MFEYVIESMFFINSIHNIWFNPFILILNISQLYEKTDWIREQPSPNRISNIVCDIKWLVRLYSIQIRLQMKSKGERLTYLVYLLILLNREQIKLNKIWAILQNKKTGDLARNSFSKPLLLSLRKILNQSKSNSKHFTLIVKFYWITFN
jgi:hypothetical protein